MVASSVLLFAMGMDVVKRFMHCLLLLSLHGVMWFYLRAFQMDYDFVKFSLEVTINWIFMNYDNSAV